MNWIVLSFLAVGFWSIGINVTKKGLATVSPLWTNIIGNGFRLVIWVPAALILSKGQIQPIDLTSLALLLMAGACFMSLYYSMSKGSAALVVAIAGLSPLITTLWMVILGKQPLSVVQGLGVGIIMVGTIFISQVIGKHAESRSWLWWGLMSALLIGTGDYLSSKASLRMGSFTSLFWLSIVMQLFSLINYWLDKPGRALPSFNRATLGTTVISQAIMWTGSLAYFLALGLGSAALVSAIGGVYVAGVALVALVWFKEKLTLTQYVGIGLCTAGMWFVIS